MSLDSCGKKLMFFCMSVFQVYSLEIVKIKRIALKNVKLVLESMTFPV